MTAPSFISAGSIAYNIDADITPTPPAHQADDILLVMAQCHTGGVLSTATAGWTEIAEIDGTDNFAWYWKRATGSGTAGPTITATGSPYQLHAICYVIRGCKTIDTPFEDATTAGTGSSEETTPDSAAITTTGSNRLVACFLSYAGVTGGWAVEPPPATWTKDNETVSTGGSDVTFVAISKQKAAAGNEGAVVIGTATSAMYWGSITLAFLPSTTATASFFLNFI